MRNKLFFIFILLLSICTLNAQEPATDAVYKKLVKEYTLHSDGSFDFHYRKELRIQTHFAFHRLFGESFILYDPAHQEVVINEAYTTMADGTKVPVPGNAINELLPRFAVDAPAYNRMREIVITHTGLETGSTIYLDYTIKSSGEFLPFFMQKVTLAEDMPIEEMEVVVNAPREENLKHKTFNLRTAPEISTENEKTVYRWTFRGLSPEPRRPFSPSDSDPVLAFTSARDMEWAFFRIVNQDAFRHDPGAELSARVQEFVKKEQDALRIMKELQRWVVDEMKTIHVPEELNPFRARPASECWSSGYATELEKAIILSDLLIKAGINAFPAYIFPKGYFDAEIGVPALASKVMVQVNPQKLKRYYLSVGHRNEKNDLYTLGSDIVLPVDGAVETLRHIEEKQEVTEMLMTGTISLDGAADARGQIALTLGAAANPYLAVYSDPASLKKYIGGSISGNDIEEVEIRRLSEHQVQAVMNIQDKEFMTSYENFREFSLPEFREGFSSFHFNLLSENRDAAVSLPYLFNELYELEFLLPEGAELVNEPGETEISNEVASVRIVLAKKGREVIINRSLKWQRSHIPVTMLDDLREIIEAWYDKNYRTLYIKQD